jgi:hypothetical protein
MEDTMDQAQEANRKRISDLLNTLKMEPDVMKLDLEGKAISRSETSLHLAGASGIMAIPLEEIVDITPLKNTNDPMMVSVSVKDATKIRAVSTVQPTTPGPVMASRLSFPGRFGGAGGLGGRRMGNTGATYCFDGYLDSGTVTFGQIDMTDDVTTVQVHDDDWV